MEKVHHLFSQPHKLAFLHPLQPQISKIQCGLASVESYTQGDLLSTTPLREKKHCSLIPHQNGTHFSLFLWELVLSPPAEFLGHWYLSQLDSPPTLDEKRAKTAGYSRSHREEQGMWQHWENFLGVIVKIEKTNTMKNTWRKTKTNKDKNVGV